MEPRVNTRLAEGVACSKTDPKALELILNGVERFVEVTDAEIAEAKRIIFDCNHNVSQGAGVAGLAAAMK